MEEIDQEQDDNEDVDICDEPDNVEMNTGASDNNVEEVKASDDEDNSDVCQPALMTPFNIDEDQRAIIKEDFIGKSDVYSHLLENDKYEKVADLFGVIFGLHNIYADSGYQISDTEAHGLFQYFIDLDETEVITILSLKINLELESIHQLIDTETNMFMTASALNIMVDSLNRYLMKVKKTKFPEVYVMKYYQMEKLRRIDDVKEYMNNKEVKKENF
jgi:hypothetical protein